MYSLLSFLSFSSLREPGTREAGYCYGLLNRMHGRCAWNCPPSSANVFFEEKTRKGGRYCVGRYVSVSVSVLDVYCIAFVLDLRGQRKL